MEKNPNKSKKCALDHFIIQEVSRKTIYCILRRQESN